MHQNRVWYGAKSVQIQTVFKAGNSNVVAIPKDLSKELGFKSGQKVVVEKTDSEDLLVRKVSKTKSVKLSPDLEFKRWWKEFLKENAEILDELAIR